MLQCSTSSSSRADRSLDRSSWLFRATSPSSLSSSLRSTLKSLLLRAPITWHWTSCPLLAGVVVAPLFTGRWVGRVGSRVPMLSGYLIAAARVLLTDLLISPTAGLSTVGWTMGVAGVGFGIIVVPVTSSSLTSIPAEISGVAASTTNTRRELGAVAGVAILGSILNGQLTVNLTHRLIAVGIPPAFRSQIISAVTTGSMNAQVKGLSDKTNATVQAIINKVVAAAYQAFADGLSLALRVSLARLLVSATVAYFTGTKDRSVRGHY